MSSANLELGGVALLASVDTARALDLARRWAAGGDAVTVVLLDSAAAAARPGHPLAGALAAALGEGATVAVHDDALRRRELPPAQVADGVKAVDLDEIADLVAEGADRVVWL